MVIIGCIDIDDITTEKQADETAKELVRACCGINRQTVMREKRALSNLMESLRKVCFVEGWKESLIEMKKGFAILTELRKTEDSMLSGLFDIT